MISTRVHYLEHIIFVDVVLSEDQNFSAAAQIAGPSGFINLNIVGVFPTAKSAIEYATRWVKTWINSGHAEKALADAFKKIRL